MTEINGERTRNGSFPFGQDIVWQPNLRSFAGQVSGNECEVGVIELVALCRLRTGSSPLSPDRPRPITVRQESAMVPHEF